MTAEINQIVRTQLGVIETICGDIESDIEGLDAMADTVKPRPAVAVINDLAALCKELRDAFEVDGRKLADMLDELEMHVTLTKEVQA